MISFAFAALAFGLFFACEEGDTQKPVIDLIEPEEGAHLSIGHDHGIHFEMNLSDNDALDSYRVQIHDAFDDHQHTRSAGIEPFYFDSVFTDIQGLRNANIHHHAILIPQGVAAGKYHLEVYCTDRAKNQAYTYRNVFLTEEEHDEEHDEDHED